jgi:hypothetical protein
MKSLLFFLLIFFSLISCATRDVAPTRESRIAIDTIYQQKVSQLQLKEDSICASFMDSVYRYAVDSMLKEREDEMKKLVK